MGSPVLNSPAELAATCSAGRLQWLMTPGCWGKSLNDWQLSALASVAAAPGAPVGAALTLPPADGTQAQTTVDSILNQQVRDQQTLNAEQINTTIGWQAAGVAVDAGNAVADAAGSVADAARAVFAMNWGLIALVLGLGVFAVVAAGSGSPRRYGR